MRKVLTFGLAMCLAVGAAVAASFTDVPRSHWAYAAVQRAADAGILQGHDDRFDGNGQINRYQMAMVVQRILDNVVKMGGPRAAGMDPSQTAELEQLVNEFADELVQHGVRITTLEESLAELRAGVDDLKMGSGPSAGFSSRGLANAFTGFVAVALVSTDDGTGTSGLGTQTRWTGTTADQTFFTIPQASMALDAEVRPGILVHAQYDYSTDVPNPVGANGVGLNEAYLAVDELFGEIGMKIGGFALPLQSWEVNGPFRTLQMSITPSVANTAFEAVRVVGVELAPVRELEGAGFIWRLAAFNSGDAAVVPGLLNSFGPMNDAVGLGGLTAAVTNDQAFGYYLDFESLDTKDWGWRVSVFDLGGDVRAVAPVPASQEQNGWQVGAWWQGERLRVQSQYVRIESQTGLGGLNDTDSTTWYMLFNWKLENDGSITLRYDDFDNILDIIGSPGNVGDAFTFAFNRKVSENSMFQFEWLSLDHENKPNVAGLTDMDDDLIQLRYKVWF